MHILAENKVLTSYMDCRNKAEPSAAMIIEFHQRGTDLVFKGNVLHK